ncbi:MAG TPA: bifunctional diaminohydroxyphosphoribosylaminopyrimidine deaminase/5-amino-6-(5-phosphoribosylamino)uracil reductase RibD [Candidatus Dormibacteraeota bacterium]|nr:bifunctional diaminohydroxyphosphoribosylaminopyrimidine deaminase/5-amino-6-(5-phosphoribosylamino)uracil reductase RibD [Candidatus Dormibacteraeota bacterium]
MTEVAAGGTVGSRDQMRRALELAKSGQGRTSPNPRVGAVLTRDGQVVGEGRHQRAGAAHAEVAALDQAGELARGATLWVTLEPCCHTGRTGPCTERLLAAGVAEVHVATLDPNPKVRGGGVAQLRAAGVSVSVGEHEAEATQLIREFAVWIVQGRPSVTLKFAMSLDGKVATALGESQWISSEPSRARAHLLRGEHDAVMVGSGTVLVDDPRLTARELPAGAHQPLRVIVDSRLRTPPSARIFSTPGGPILVATTDGRDAGREAALTAAGAEVLTLPAVDGRVPLSDLLQRLGERQVTSLLVEGGPVLLGSFWEQRLGDRIAAFVAPILVGGAGAPGPLGGLGAPTLERSWRVRGLRAEPVGPDLLLTAEV